MYESRHTKCVRDRQRERERETSQNKTTTKTINTNFFSAVVWPFFPFTSIIYMIWLANAITHTIAIHHVQRSRFHIVSCNPSRCCLRRFVCCFFLAFILFFQFFGHILLFIIIIRQFYPFFPMPSVSVCIYQIDESHPFLVAS